MRLIDADALLREIPGYNPVKYTYEYGDVVTVEDIISIPIIDAVPVVRCKDCEYFSKEINLFWGKCTLRGDHMFTNDFCSYGVRMVNNEID